MKKLILISILTLLMLTPVLANPSVHFTTIPGTFSYTLSESAGIWTLSFTQASMEVDTSNPTPDAVLFDKIGLPSMTLSSIGEPLPGILQATLTPSGPLTITDNTGANGTVMTASLINGGMLVMGSNFLAYSDQVDDLNVTGYTAGYSVVIDAFANGDAAGYPLDFNFTGGSTTNLYALIKSGTGSANGSIEGNISLVIPAPGAIALGSIGVALVGWLRRKRTL